MRIVTSLGASARSHNLFLALACPGLLALLGSAFAAASSERRSLNQGPGVSNHPVNVIPSSAVSIPAGWPLGPGGIITCGTCHTAFPGSRGEELKLRGSQGAERRAFCTNCHGASKSQSAAGMHWLAVPRAHIGNWDSGVSSAASIDRASAECLSCHDGVSAGETGYGLAVHQSGDYSDPRRNHPVGVRYPRQGTTRTEVPLRPSNMLPPTVQLPGGAVSCISCHDLYNLTPKRLSVPTTGSQLCFTCHNMN